MLPEIAKFPVTIKDIINVDALPVNRQLNVLNMLLFTVSFTLDLVLF
jgi:hypothetical protein